MTEARPYFHSPALSPDGRLVAFVHASDVWLVERSGGSAERLTAHYAYHARPLFSPDGSRLVFSSTRTGGGDLYYLPLDMGTVERVTYLDAACTPQDWTPDSKQLYFTLNHEQQGTAVYRVPLAGGTPIQLYAEPYESLTSVAVAPNGSELALNLTHGRWWRRGPNPYAPSSIWLAAALPLPVPNPVELAENIADTALPQQLVGSGTDLAAPYSGLNRWPLWTPDGRGIYFVSDRDGVENIWLQPIDGGPPRQITHFKDGRLLWPTIARTTGTIVFERAETIWQLDLASGETAPLLIQARVDTKFTPVYTDTRLRSVQELALSPDGKKTAFVVRGEIFADFASKDTDKELRQGLSFRVTKTQARESEPIWTPNSRAILYLSDRHGEPEIYRYDFASRTETRLTHDQQASKSHLACSPDGKWVAYIYGTDQIYLLQLETGETHPFARGSFVWSRGLAWSPDSRWLAYISHDKHFFGNVHVQRIDTDTSRQITFLSNVSGSRLLWSPDGRFLIFTTGQYRREAQIVRVDLRPPEPLFREAEFEKLFAEQKKPSEREQEQPAEEQQRAGGNGAPTTDPPAGAGKATTTTRAQTAEPPNPEQPPVKTSSENQPTDQETPSETPSNGKDKQVEIVFAGIERRLQFLTPPQLDADAQAISPNSRDLLFRAEVAEKTNIWALALDEPRQDNPLRQLTQTNGSKRSVQFAPDAKTFYYIEDGQITIRKFPFGNEPTSLQTRAEQTVDFHQEKLQIFSETWRLLRDTFYDAAFRGRDWAALHDYYLPLVQGAQTQGDVTGILNLMIGELSASHTGVYWYGGSAGEDGYIGLIFDAVELSERGLLRVAALLPDGPAALLAEPPQIGEYLMAVNDVPLTPTTSLNQLLSRTIGQRVRLRFAPTPESDTTRELAVRPINDNRYGELRYRAWVRANAAYVNRASDGRLGYVHIAEMSYAAYQQFLLDLDAETQARAGVVVDIRYNRGGHISTFILDVLARQQVLRAGFRDHATSDVYHLSGNRRLQKPTILVTNEASFSDAEVFTEIYRRLGLGQVVGKPTGGGVIGTVGVTLLNGSTLRLPMYAYHTLEGADLEGEGRPVDMLVERPLGEWVIGRDRQLDAAVAALLESLPDGPRS